MLLSVFFIIHIASIVSALDCGETINGNTEITCGSYIHCVGRVATRINCTFEQVYNPQTQTCDLRTHAPLPCTIERNCIGKANRKHYDIETNCTTYYTCHEGFFYGHNFCSPGLVFDVSIQQCNWPKNVAQPCGSANTAPVVAIGRR